MRLLIEDDNTISDYDTASLGEKNNIELIE